MAADGAVEPLRFDVQLGPELEVAMAEHRAEVDAMVTASTGHPFRLNNRRTSTDDELRTLLAAAGAAA